MNGGQNYSNEDPNEILNRKLLLQQQVQFQQQQQQQQLQHQQQLHNVGRTSSQTINPYDYYYQQAKPPQATGSSNYQKSLSNNQK